MAAVVVQLCLLEFVSVIDFRHDLAACLVALWWKGASLTFEKEVVVESCAYLPLAVTQIVVQC